MLCLGGDHFITYPILKAHANKHGPVALLQFDSHSDTWREDGKRIDHGTMFFHGVEEGVIDATWLDHKPKWQKHAGRPVSYALVWRRGGQA